MRRTLSAAIFLALIAAPAGAAECGPATYTTDEPTPVIVQIGDGRIEAVVDGTAEWWGDYHSAADGSWAVWDTDGNLLASGNLCPPEPVVVEPELKESAESFNNAARSETPLAYLPAGVRAQ